MQRNVHRDDTRRIAERAAEWLCVLENASDEETAAFAEWIAESPLHLREFLFISALDSEAANADPQRSIDINALLAKSSRQVVSIPEKIKSARKSEIAQPALHAKSPHQLRRRWLVGLAAGIAVAVSGTALVIQLQGQSYGTAVGEQQTIELTDGSIIQLSTRSRVRVQFSNNEREIRLSDGEAMFKVARDSTRPFRVYAGNSVIQAVGTQFNVNRRPSGTTVSVLEGTVKVLGDNASDTKPKTSGLLNAGEEVRIGRNGSIERFAKIDPLNGAAWRQHRLVFRDDTLEDIAAEFNRYNRSSQIRLEGDEVLSRRYTAVFDANDPKSLVEFLRQDSGLILEHEGDVVVCRPRR